MEVSKELRSLQEEDMLEVIGGIHVRELDEWEGVVRSCHSFEHSLEGSFVGT